MYDLEADPCEDPTQPAIVNCLDAALRTVHSMKATWHRRVWLRRLIEEVWEGRSARFGCSTSPAVDPLLP